MPTFTPNTVERIDAPVSDHDTEEIIPEDVLPPDDTEPPEDTAPTEDTTASDDGETTEQEEIALPPNVKIIYMTFDDGPGKYTETVLDTLDEYGITAAFFLVGKYAARAPESVRLIAERGHLIGYHSSTHDYAEIYESPAALSADIELWENTVSDILGYVPDEHIFRFPGGSTCSAIGAGEFDGLFDAVKNKGYTVYDWSCGNNDAWYAGMREGQTKQDYFRESLDFSLKVCGGVRILLLHETVYETVEMLPEMIEYLLERGYVFLPLNTYSDDYVFSH